MRFGYPVLISIDFNDFPFPFTPQFLFRLRRYIKQSRQCFIDYPNTSNVVKNPGSKIFRCASYFQLSSRCLHIPMKHCLSCLLYYVRISDSSVTCLDVPTKKKKKKTGLVANLMPSSRSFCQVAIVNNCKACMDFTEQLKVHVSHK